MSQRPRDTGRKGREKRLNQKRRKVRCSNILTELPHKMHKKL